MIITDKFIVKWNPSNREWYTSKGYQFTKWHDEIEVKMDELSPRSNYLIEFKCDYCDRVHKRQYDQYKDIYSNDLTGKHSCGECGHLRRMENEKIKLAKIDILPISTYETQYKLSLPDLGVVFVKLCRTCKKLKEVSCFNKNDKYKIVEYDTQCNECYKEYRELNSTSFRLRHIKESSVKMNLPVHMTEKQFERMLERFDNKCALTKSINIVCEHFIPVSWGHGGTYEGNIYLLSNSLNISKGNDNPFEWVKKKKVKEKVNIRAWNKLIKYLASQNKLTVNEFIKFVYWCEENKRAANEVNLTPEISSIEIWRESIKLHN